MSETNTPATATSAAPVATAPIIKGINIKGTTISFKSVTNPRAKGPEKGAPILLPSYAGPSPVLADVLRVATALGADQFAVVAYNQILKPLSVEASKAARVQAADGSFSIDEGKFTIAAEQLLRDYTSTQSAKQKLEAELAAIEEAISKFTNAMLDAMAKGETIPVEARNKASQLIAERAALQNKLTKRTPATAAPAAAAK